MYGAIIANAGLPMIVLPLPLMAIALLPIIVLEAFIANRRLELSRPRLLGGIGFANIVSTFIGIPLAWGVMLFLERSTVGGKSHGLESPLGVFVSVVAQAPWLVPYEDELYWMIPIAVLVLLVPRCLVSVLAEWLVLIFVWKVVPRPRVTRTVWFINAVSYALLAVLVSVIAALAITGELLSR